MAMTYMTSGIDRQLSGHKDTHSGNAPHTRAKVRERVRALFEKADQVRNTVDALGLTDAMYLTEEDAYVLQELAAIYGTLHADLNRVAARWDRIRFAQSTSKEQEGRSE